MSSLASPLPVGFRFSQSSLQDYVDCPRRFRLRYLDQLEYPALETEPVLEYERQQGEGARFHRLVQQYFLGIPLEKLQPLVGEGNLQVWWQSFLSFAQGNLDGLKTRLPEFSLSAPLGKYRLLAKYDLLTITADDRLVIFDWKASRKRPANEWLVTRWQTRVYRWLALQAGTHLHNGKPFEPEQVEMVYWLAGAPDDPARFPYSHLQAKRDFDVLQAIVAEIEVAQDFPLTDDERHCRFCPYRSYCDRGRFAGAPEDAMGDFDEPEDLFDIDFEQISEIAF